MKTERVSAQLAQLDAGRRYQAVAVVKEEAVVIPSSPRLNSGRATRCPSR